MAEPRSPAALLHRAIQALDADALSTARALALQLLDASPSPEALAQAHAIGSITAPDLEALDAHLEQLQFASMHGPPRVPQLARLLEHAARRWTARDPTAAARIRALQHTHAAATGFNTEPLRAALRQLRLQGAAVPLGPLDAEQEVRRGGMGRVWRGRVRGTDLDVAIKVLDASKAADPQVTAALNRELRAIARLDHPSIVPIVDFGEVDDPAAALTDGILTAGTPWLATRWADFGTLEAWCGRRPYPEVREALLQLLDALAVAHAEGMVHLDVKPANVLVAAQSPLVIWLSDFGIAQAVHTLGAGRVAGTPSFMAPEQCLGERGRFGPWTDLYALGHTAIALVQGEPLFSGDSVAVMQEQIARPVPPLAPRIPVPPGFEAWCMRMLTKAPGDRFRCAADAAHALRALGDPTDEMPTPTQPLQLSSATPSTFFIDLPPPPSPPPASPIPTPQTAPPMPARPAPMPASPPRARRRPIVPALVRAAHRLQSLREVPLVGREEAKQRLWAALHDAEDGLRVIGLASAGPGTGRTRLLQWLAQTATLTGAARVVWVGPSGGDPWRDAMARLLGVEGLSPEQVQRRLVDHARLRANLPLTHALTLNLVSQALWAPDDPRGALDPLPALVRALHTLCEERRVLVCIATEDPGVPWFIERLRAGGSQLPLLVVGLAGCMDPNEAEIHRLFPLGEEALHTLVDTTFPLDPALKARVIEASGGEPATLVWTVRTWMAEGRLIPSPSGMRLRTPEPIPTSLTEALRRAFQPHLDEDPRLRRQLTMLALLGIRVKQRLWEAGCAQIGAPLDPAQIEPLLTKGLLLAPRGGFHLAGEAVRRLVLDEFVDPDERAALHRAAAAVHGDDGARATHLLAAGDRTEALAPLARGLHRATGRNRREAKRLMQRWEQIRPRLPLPPDDLARLQVQVALWRWVSPPTADEAPAVARALARLRTHDDPETLAWALVARARLEEHAGDHENAIDTLNQALELASSSGLRRKLLWILGRAHLRANAWEAALVALSEAQQLGLSMVTPWRVMALRALGRFDEGARLLEIDPGYAHSPVGYTMAVYHMILRAKLAEVRHDDRLAEEWLLKAHLLGASTSPHLEALALSAGLSRLLRQGEPSALRDLLRRLERLHPDPRHAALAALFDDGETPDASPLAPDLRWDGGLIEAPDVAGILRLAAELPRWAPWATALRAQADLLDPRP